MLARVVICDESPPKSLLRQRFLSGECIHLTADILAADGAWSTAMTRKLDMFSSKIHSPLRFPVIFLFTRWRHTKWPRRSCAILRHFQVLNISAKRNACCLLLGTEALEHDNKNVGHTCLMRQTLFYTVFFQITYVRYNLIRYIMTSRDVEQNKVTNWLLKYDDAYIHTYIHTYIHIYIHTNINTCIALHTNSADVWNARRYMQAGWLNKCFKD